jgi:hypothetical protein
MDAASSLYLSLAAWAAIGELLPPAAAPRAAGSVWQSIQFLPGMWFTRSV